MCCKIIRKVFKKSIHVLSKEVNWDRLRIRYFALAVFCKIWRQNCRNTRNRVNVLVSCAKRCERLPTVLQAMEWSSDGTHRRKLIIMNGLTSFWQLYLAFAKAWNNILMADRRTSLWNVTSNPWRFLLMKEIFGSEIIYLKTWMFLGD